MNVTTIPDGMIAAMYFCIAVALFWIGVKRVDLNKNRILWIFTLVFALCGMGHLMHFIHNWSNVSEHVVITMWVQAIVAIPAFVSLIPVVKYLIKMPTMKDYEERGDRIEYLEHRIEELRERLGEKIRGNGHNFSDMGASKRNRDYADHGDWRSLEGVSG